MLVIHVLRQSNFVHIDPGYILSYRKDISMIDRRVANGPDSVNSFLILCEFPTQGTPRYKNKETN
jgi:hypothetical protein